MSGVEDLRAEVAGLRAEVEALRGQLVLLDLELGGRLDALAARVADGFEVVAGAILDGSGPRR